MTLTRIAWLSAALMVLGGRMSYPPALSLAKGQTADQQDDECPRV